VAAIGVWRVALDVLSLNRNRAFAGPEGPGLHRRVAEAGLHPNRRALLSDPPSYNYVFSKQRGSVAKRTKSALRQSTEREAPEHNRQMRTKLRSALKAIRVSLDAKT